MPMFAVIILFVIIVLLELYLAHRPSRWPGLVLPGISLAFSLLYPLNMADMGQGFGTLAAQLLLVWLLANIPTLILLAIYFAARCRVKNTREYERMRAQDLG